MAETIQRVADLMRPPVVGRRYLVMCAQEWDGGPWLPIIGPAHGDPELGLKELHWHHDLRFFTKRLARRYWETVEAPYWHDDGPGWELLGNVRLAERCGGQRHPVEEREMRCQRQMPEFRPLPLLVNQKWGKLQRKYRRACLSPCKVCPHRGMPLGSIAPNAAGEIVCPGHGLRFSAETGKLIMQMPTDPARASG